MASRTAVSAEPAPSVPISRSAVKPAIRSSRAASTAMIVRCGTDSCTVCKSSAPGCRNKCTCASINPGMSVRSPRSITSDPAGRFTDGPASTMRSPCTSTSPGFTTRPLLTSNSRAARSTTVCGVAASAGTCAAEIPHRNSERSNENENNSRGSVMSAGMVPPYDLPRPCWFLGAGATEGLRALTRRYSSSPTCRSSAKLQTFQFIHQSLLYLLLVFCRQLLPPRGQIKRIDRHLPLGVNQSDLNIALLVRQAGTDPVQQPRPVLRNHLEH